jgi:hypothetical protein
MVADGMLTRQRYREVPPRVDYELTERARELMPILGELARWGYEWAWGSPRPAERIDVGAIFRIAPGLVHLPRSVRGKVELTVDASKQGGKISTYTMAASGGRVSIQERQEPEANARVSGDLDAWVAAFSPDRDRSGLDMSGDESLATQVLDGLAVQERQRNGRSAVA